MAFTKHCKYVVQLFNYFLRFEEMFKKQKLEESKWNLFDMENFCLKFPHLGDEIVGQLNPQTLVNLKRANRFWSKTIDDQRCYWIRKIENRSIHANQFNRDWSTVVRKTPLKVLKELSKALYIFYIKPDIKKLGMSDEAVSEIKKLFQVTYNFDDQWSPLHIAAKFDLNLFKEVSLKFKDINPANNYGETPLHCATKNGHLDICKFIIKNVTLKNPADKLGFTPLHYAAMMDELEIYKLIAPNVESEDSKEDFGITPNHFAQKLGCKKICKFNSEKGLEDQNEIQLSILAKIKMNLIYIKTRVLDKLTSKEFEDSILKVL